MKREAFLLALIVIFLGSGPSISYAGTVENLKDAFKNIPDSVQTAVYWYWMNDNISKEGVIKDLEAMKAVGINKAFIGNQQADDIPYGNVLFGSDEWLDITHTAMKKATELGIEIGMFNCPGWSQSGGPWVKPEESMRRLSFIEGFPSDTKGLDIVKVLALPNIKETTLTKKAVSKAGELCAVEFEAPEGFTARTISVTSDSRTDRRVKVLADGKVIKEFFFDRHRLDLNVGFEPLAPVVISLPETSASHYVVIIGKYRKPVDVSLEVKLSDSPMVEEWPEKTLAKMYQDPLPMWDHYMWRTPEECSDKSRIIKAEDVLDITEFVKNGKLGWKDRDNRYRVLTVCMTGTGVTNSPAVKEATGLEIDKMSRKHIRTHFNAFIGKLIENIPEQDRKTWKVVVQDSYETGGLNWTDDMLDVFKSTYGYDPTPYLPVVGGIQVGSADQSERFLWDLRRLIADRVAFDYVGGLRDICHEHGMETWLETYGHWGFPSEFLLYGGMSDQVAGEFWSEGSLGDIENRAASSCGHIYGKNKIWAESCTAGAPQFSRYPLQMKERVDRFFCEGINASLLHLFIQQPDDRKPGLDAWFGNEFNRNNAWFDGLDVFIQYLKRCNLMLQQGRYVADVAYFIGEDAPKMTGVCDPALPYGYSFDYINADVLLNHCRMEGHTLVLDSGMCYDVLVLPKQKTMRPEILKKLIRLTEQGLTIVGPSPEKSPSLQDYEFADKFIKDASKKLWNKNGRLGLGKVFNEGTELTDVFEYLGIAPDFRCKAPEGSRISFIHRTLGNGNDIYFIANQKDEKVNARIYVRTSWKSVLEIWNPLTGETRVAGSGNELDIQLDRLQSIFVVCRQPNPSDGKVIVPATISDTLELSGPWKVDFAESSGNKAFSRNFKNLKDWAVDKDPLVRHFGGKATYRKTVVLDKKNISGRISLDLGKVIAIGKVCVNGQYAGGAWTYPYEVNISGLLKEGANKIEITVYNNWRNRLIGDASLPEHKRKTWTNISPWKEDSDLQQSGLTGPVRLIFRK